MLESDGLDPTTEKCVTLFLPIECGVQLRDHGLGLIGNDDRRTAASLRLMVAGARQRASNSYRYLRTTVRPKARRGSEQYQVIKSSIAAP
jgi:hypothetical protein